MIDIDIKLEEGAVIPKKAHEEDYCYDCIAVSEEEVAPNVWKYKLGIHLQCSSNLREVDVFNTAFSVYPRSSIWKTGMVLSNSVGIVDQNYTGEICAIFYHVMPNMPRYKVGDRVCQLHLEMSPKLKFNVVDKLEDTNRGENGFGSSGR